MYFVKARRWQMSTEKLLSLGFPVHPTLASAMGGLPTLPVRDRRRATAIAGNCMHLSSLLLAVFIALSCFGEKNLTE